MLNVDLYVGLNTLKYSRHSYQSRNKIKIDSETGWTWLVVPTKKVSNNTCFNHINLDYSYDWKKKHLKSIYLSYRRSKYFDEIFQDIKNIYERKHIKLGDLVLDFIEYGIKSFDIKTNFILSSDLEKKGFKSFKSKSEYVLDLCKFLKVNNFLFGANSKKYFFEEHKKKFFDNNVNFQIQHFKYIQYPQLHGSFVEALSFIDLLFNIGKKDSSKFLANPWRFRKL